jgi:tetratricopeptide (TPR) repeat protein
VARIFLAYDRDDLDRARTVAGAIQRARHTVWWDRNIQGGAQYNREVEQALNEADAIVVLWSEHSIDSTWVRDEAAVGRDRGRLIPILIDEVSAPLGFRQFQNIDLSKWNGRGRSVDLKDLLATIASLAAKTDVRPSKKVRPKKKAVSDRISPNPEATAPWQIPWKLAAVLPLLVIAAAFAIWRLTNTNSRVPLVAVAAAEPAPVANELARDLLVKLGRLQSVRPNALNLVHGEAGQKADLVLQVAGSRAAQQSNASLVLMDGRNRSVLWSNDFQRPLADEADLKQQLGYTSAQVLGCALEGVNAPGKDLDQQTFKAYLTACAALADLATGDPGPLLPILRQVVEKSPRFAGAWGKLLDVEAELARNSSLPAYDPKLVSALRRDIAEARKIDPNLPETYVAEARLVPPANFLEQGRLLDLAVAHNPRNASALSQRSTFLQAVGRLRESIEDGRRAVELDPLTPAMRDNLVAILTYTGKFDAARQELQNAERLWPGATSLQMARYRLELRYGDPKEALQILRYGKLGSPADTLQETFLQARINRTPENIDKTVRLAQAITAQVPDGASSLIQTLAEFDRAEELIRTLLRWRRMDRVDAITNVLFRPAFGKLHRDRRFMQVAQHLGLLNYWRKSGKWPDICMDPDLPYNCKVEAAKLT